MYVCMYVWMDGWMDGWMYLLKSFRQLLCQSCTAVLAHCCSNLALYTVFVKVAKLLP